jgi:hypothetical protein
MRRLGFHDAVTWTFVPSSADVVGTLGERRIVYHCVDEYSAFTDAAPEIHEREQELLRKAHLVMVCSTALLEGKKRANSAVHLVTHGVDYEHFRRAAEVDTPVAVELADLPKPILGFHGLIADWVDLPLLAEIARMRPQWSIVLIGRSDTSLRALRSLPNVHLLGHRPYERLPEYLRGFDIALLPFVNNKLTINANPLKLREYLAAGLPVVATPIPEVVRLAPPAHLASTTVEYVKEIETILAEGRTGPQQRRSAAMACESWDYKVAEMEALLEEASNSSLEETLRAHAKRQGWTLEQVGESRGRHSAILGYRERNSGRAIVVKRTTAFHSVEQARTSILREYDDLREAREKAGSALRTSLPEPLAVFPEHLAIVMTQVPGEPLSALLKRNANALAGWLGGQKLEAIGRSVGRRLRAFHDATRCADHVFDSHVFYEALSKELVRCAKIGLDTEATKQILEHATRTLWRIDGRRVVAAARHGDFIPQNILIARGEVGFADFESFAAADTIYEDAATFTAYLAIMERSPWYSKTAIGKVRVGFCEGYGVVPTDPILQAYMVKFAATMLAESGPGRNNTAQFLRHRKQLLQLSMNLEALPRNEEILTAAGGASA